MKGQFKSIDIENSRDFVYQSGQDTIHRRFAIVLCEAVLILVWPRPAAPHAAS
jgi:hypothetical protein